MAIKDKILAHVEHVMTTDQEDDAFDNMVIRMQAIVDERIKTDLEFIDVLSSTYYGRITLVQTFNLKWFSECLYSQPVLDILLENLISAVESSGDKSIPVPNLWRNLFTGKPNAIMPEKELENEAFNALNIIDLRQSQEAA